MARLHQMLVLLVSVLAAVEIRASLPAGDRWVAAPRHVAPHPVSRGLLVRGGADGISLSVTLRGKKYDVADAVSVADIQASIEEQAGLAVAQQAVLYKGKMLAADATLAGAGLVEGDSVSVVPMKPKKASDAAVDKADLSSLSPAAAGGGASDDLFGSAGAAGGGAAAGGGGLGALSSMFGMPDMSQMSAGDMGAMGEQYEKMMESMIDSPMIDELLNDPEKIEQSRQLILENPMMVSMFKQVPGMEEMINDKDLWASQMKEQIIAQRDAFRAKKAAGGGAAGAV